MNTVLACVCADCGREPKKVRAAKDGSAKTPKGWRKVNAEFVCRDCAQSRWMIRSVRLQIVGVGEGEERSNRELWTSLNAASEASARFANWLVQLMLSRDLACAATLTRTAAGKVTLGPMPSMSEWLLRSGATATLARDARARQIAASEWLLRSGATATLVACTLHTRRRRRSG